MKHTDWLNRLKKKQQQLYSAYKKFTGNNIECEKDRKPYILNPSRNKSEQGYLFLISDKTKIKKNQKLKRDKGHYIMTEGSIQQEAIIIM